MPRIQKGTQKGDGLNSIQQNMASEATAYVLEVSSDRHMGHVELIVVPMAQRTVHGTNLSKACAGNLAVWIEYYLWVVLGSEDPGSRFRKSDGKSKEA